jgi:DNA-binding winged helix-turn-helix (wHTH) protein
VSTLVSASQQAEIGPEESRDLLSRVVNSQELKRSARLRELLLYLGKRSLKSPNTIIREQEIGAAVFERPEDYDTNIDNIVRVNVSELRKRLAHYFSEEGAQEKAVVEIPRGGYSLVFLPRPVEPEKPESIPPSTTNDIAPSSALQEEVSLVKYERERSAFVRRTMAVVWSVVLLVAMGVVSFLYWQNHALRSQLRPWQANPVSAAFWSQFFASGDPVDIVTADTSYALAEDMLQRPISLDDYLDYKYKSYADLPGITPATRDALNLVLDRNTGSVGDFEAAERIMELDSHSTALKLASARAYTPQSIKNNNVVLIGSRESNPWVELYKDKLNFYVEYDPKLHRSYIVNRAPVAGEQSVYEVLQDKDHAYSVVAFVPNLSDHRYTLIIAGTDSQGTRAAGEFITSSAGIAAIRQRLPAEKYPYFEVLLSSSRLEGTTLNTSIQAFRGHER